MSSIIGYDNIDQTLSGIQEIYSDVIYTNNIYVNENLYLNNVNIDDNFTTINNEITTLNNDLTTYETTTDGTLTSLQNQINSITGISTSGGGTFNVWFETSAGFDPTTTPYQWSMGNGNKSTNSFPLPLTYACTLDKAYWKSSGTPTTSGSVSIEKNGTGVFTMSGLNTALTTLTFSPNISFVSGDNINIKTIAGAAGGSMRIFLAFSTIGIRGTDGTNGADGATGPTGPEGPKGNKGDTGDPLDPVQLAIVLAEAAAAGGVAGGISGGAAGAESGSIAGAIAGSEAAIAEYELRVLSLEEKTTNQNATIGTTTFMGNVRLNNGVSNRVILKSDGYKSEFGDGLICDGDLQINNGNITTTGTDITIDSKLNINGIMYQNAESCYLTYNSTGGLSPIEQYIKLRTIPETLTLTKNEILFKSYNNSTTLVDYDSRIYCEGGNDINNSRGNITLDTDTLTINSRGLTCGIFEYPLMTSYAGRLTVSELVCDNILSLTPSYGYINFNSIVSNDITANDSLLTNSIYRANSTNPFEICSTESALNIDIGGSGTSGNIDFINGSCVIDKDSNTLQLGNGFQLKIKNSSNTVNNRISTGVDGKFYIDADTAQMIRLRVYDGTNYITHMEISNSAGIQLKEPTTSQNIFQCNSLLKVNEINRKDDTLPLKICDGETTCNFDIFPVATSGNIDIFSGDINIDKTTGVFIKTTKSLWIGDSASDASTRKIRFQVNSSGNQFFDIGTTTSRLQMRIGTTLKYDFNNGDLFLQSGGTLKSPNIEITNKTTLGGIQNTGVSTTLTFPLPEFIFLTGTGNYTITLPLLSSGKEGSKTTFIKTGSTTNNITISTSDNISDFGSITAATSISLGSGITTCSIVASSSIFWRTYAKG